MPHNSKSISRQDFIDAIQAIIESDTPGKDKNQNSISLLKCLLASSDPVSSIADNILNNLKVLFPSPLFSTNPLVKAIETKIQAFKENGLLEDIDGPEAEHQSATNELIESLKERLVAGEKELAAMEKELAAMQEKAEVSIKNERFLQNKIERLNQALAEKDKELIIRAETASRLTAIVEEQSARREELLDHAIATRPEYAENFEDEDKDYDDNDTLDTKSPSASEIENSGSPETVTSEDDVSGSEDGSEISEHETSESEDESDDFVDENLDSLFSAALQSGDYMRARDHVYANEVSPKDITRQALKNLFNIYQTSPNDSDNDQRQIIKRLFEVMLSKKLFSRRLVIASFEANTPITAMLCELDSLEGLLSLAKQNLLTEKEVSCEFNNRQLKFHRSSLLGFLSQMDQSEQLYEMWQCLVEKELVTYQALDMHVHDGGKLKSLVVNYQVRQAPHKKPWSLRFNRFENCTGSEKCNENSSTALANLLGRGNLPILKLLLAKHIINKKKLWEPNLFIPSAEYHRELLRIAPISFSKLSNIQIIRYNRLAYWTDPYNSSQVVAEDNYSDSYFEKLCEFKLVGDALFLQADYLQRANLADDSVGYELRSLCKLVRDNWYEDIFPLVYMLFIHFQHPLPDDNKSFNYRIEAFKTQLIALMYSGLTQDLITVIMSKLYPGFEAAGNYLTSTLNYLSPLVTWISAKTISHDIQLRLPHCKKPRSLTFFREIENIETLLISRFCTGLADKLLTQTNREKITLYFVDNWDEIKHDLSDEMMQRYIEQAISDKPLICAVSGSELA